MSNALNATLSLDVSGVVITVSIGASPAAVRRLSGDESGVFSVRQGEPHPADLFQQACRDMPQWLDQVRQSFSINLVQLASAELLAAINKT